MKPNLNIRRPLTFVGSFVTHQSVPHFASEFAFVGRSNVGKSSLINLITEQKIARTSKTPGRTQAINVFKAHNHDAALIDLPGYGFSSNVKTSVKSQWPI